MSFGIWFSQNWQNIALVVLAIILCIYGIVTGNALQWLRYAVAVAEEDLGSGTGQLKLRKVYDMFIAKYPKFSVFVPFPIFSKYVDLALEWFKAQLDTNPNVKARITSSKEDA